MTTDDFFDTEPERQNGMPLIRPAAKRFDTIRSDREMPLVPYTRASGLADYISDDRHIHTWKMRYLARGMGQSPDLCALAAIETYSTGFDADLRTKSASGRRLDSIIERALDRVGIAEKADYGTAVHGFTEPALRDLTPPERMAADVASFWAAVKEWGIVILGTEIFTACDETQSAGTFDHLIYIPGYGIVISDKKTGRMQGHHFGVQLSTYANSDIYDFNTHERESLEDYVARTHPEIWALEGEINRDVGIVFAIKDGKTELHEVDLAMGFHGAKAAAAARNYLDFDGMLSTASKTGVKTERKKVLARMEDVTTEEELLALWRETKHLWDDDLTTASKIRKQAIA